MTAKEGTPVTIDWGRRKHANFSNGVKATGLMLASPALTLLLTMNMKENHGNLNQLIDVDALHSFWRSLTFENLLQMHQIIAGYLVFQATLYKFLPGAHHTGQHTPDGQLLQYKTNGMLAFVVTCACFWLGDSLGLYKATYIASNFGVLVAALNIWGLTLTIAAYVRACLSPTSSRDRVFTGNMIYDICMGVELNPRIPIIDDVKIFVVGRVGMMLWPIILASFTVFQYEKTGNISGAMLVGVALQYEYIIDFFWNEHWYLRTIDIAHDHVGFYMVWGCFAWLPSTYTLHAQFMAHSEASISDDFAAFLFVIGTAGYILFRLANNQKYRVRETSGRCNAWGKPATYITARYTTADGAERESILLTCGWWGVSRHFNYVGDMVFSFATCATTGFGALLPWFYAIFLWVLLFHRCIRDEARCAKKYGAAWQTYCSQVRWRLVPYLI